MVWGFVPLHTVDFSRELNDEVARLSGEAVIDVTINTAESGLNWFIFVHWIPFWPACVHVDVKGTVVRRKATTGSENGRTGPTAFVRG